MVIIKSGICVNSNPRNLLGLILLFFIISCNQRSYNYPQDRNIADEKGKLADSLGFYYSNNQIHDSSQFQLVKDTFWQQYLAANLFEMNEPVLFNDYLGSDRYRFLWLRSFHAPIVFIIIKKKGRFFLTTKKLSRPPFYEDHCCQEKEEKIRLEEVGYRTQIDTIENGGADTLYSIIGDRQSEIIYDSTILLTKNDWNQFNRLINESDFWNLKVYDWAGYADGSLWLIEAHLQGRYKYIMRQSPSGKINKIGKFLLQLSGLHEEFY